MNGWTAERKARQAELIRTWEPWRKSTGPKSDEGKAISAANSTVHGMRSQECFKSFRELKAFITQCRNFIEK